MIDWAIVVVVFIAALAGAVGGSAQPGDRLSDIPQVFMRRPATFLFSSLVASIIVIAAQLR